MDNLSLIELNRSWIEVKGPDAKKFLNGLLTNDINKLADQAGCYALLLTHKGRILADCFCYACGPYFGIDCEATLKPILLETFKKYIVFQKVELIDQSDRWKTFAVVGSLTRMYRILSGQMPTAEYHYEQVFLGGIKIWIIFKKLWNLSCLELWVKKEEAQHLKDELNLPELSAEEQEVLRIESGTPKFGIDFDSNTIPQEACLHHALSFTKGCYIGQEIVARLEHRGHVGKQLVQLFLEEKSPPRRAPPARGEKIFSEEGKEAGRVTSSCFSPKQQKSIALGFIAYPFLGLTKVRVPDQTALLQKLCQE